MIRSATSLTLLAALTACASPNPPTVTSSEVAQSFDEATILSTRPFTDTVDLPTGGVTYKGGVGADVSGELNGSIQGDMTMNVQFNGNTIDGRIDDINWEGIDLIRQIAEIYAIQQYDTEILAASIRTANHVKLSAMAGADVATVPPGVIKGLATHPLTDKGLAAFLADAEKGGVKV